MDDDEFEIQVCEYEDIIDACKKFMMKWGESKESMIRGLTESL